MSTGDLAQKPSFPVTTSRTKRVFVLIGVAAFATLSLYGCVQLFGSSGTNASPWRANYFLRRNFTVPESATDIYYFTDWAATEAEFSIVEIDFLSWCRSNGWKPSPINKPIKYFYPVWGPKEDNRLVNRGYYCYAAGGVLVFDAEQSRAAFHVSEFP